MLRAEGQVRAEEYKVAEPTGRREKIFALPETLRARELGLVLT